MNCMLPPAAWLSIERLNDPSTAWKNMAEYWNIWSAPWMAPWSTWTALPSQPWTATLNGSLPWWLSPWTLPTTWWATTTVSTEPVPPISSSSVGSSGAVVEAAAVTVPPVARIERPTSAADNLTRIEGIGPKIAEILKSGGIRTFAELTDTAVPRLQALLKAAGPRYRLARPDTWSEQAGLLARGDEAGFAALAAALRGGVRA
jgi:predicted flap endonuclease-1-like 5' DNA nuclease